MIMESMYYFPPFQKRFYCSLSLDNYAFNKNVLYNPHSKILSLIFSLWKKNKFFRDLFICKYADLPKNLAESLSYLNKYGDDFQALIGTKGIEQKNSFLIYKNNKPVIFAKSGTSEKSNYLIDKEFNTLIHIQHLKETPKPLDLKIINGLNILITSIINGAQLKKIELDDKVFDFILSIKEIKSPKIINELIYVFSHGDCCPWNYLYNEESDIFLIDWEFGGYYPLGYDLLTFIFRTNFLLKPKVNIEQLLIFNNEKIKKYYFKCGIYEYDKYLLEIIEIQLEIVKNKGNERLISNWLKFKKIILNR